MKHLDFFEILKQYKKGEMYDEIDDVGSEGLWNYIGDALPFVESYIQETQEGGIEAFTENEIDLLEGYRNELWGALYNELLGDVYRKIKNKAYFVEVKEGDNFVIEIPQEIYDKNFKAISEYIENESGVAGVTPHDLYEIKLI